MHESFDAIVLGAGPAGEVIAGRLADAGLEVAIVESRLVGGECTFWACMPSKALLRPGEGLAEVRRIPGAREAVTGRLDATAVLARRDEIIHDEDDATMVPWLEDKGITLVRDRGHFTGPRTLQAGDRTLEARRAIVVATGSRAAVPPIPGLREAAPWTNIEATTAKHVPPRLVILGGGVVGCEMAQAYASLGSQVSLVEGSHRLLAKEEEFASDDVRAGLEEAGVGIFCGGKAQEVRRPEPGGRVTLVLEDGTELDGDELLCATGRIPNTQELQVEAAGVELDEKGYLAVDEELRVPGGDGLFAIGDVTGRVLLTHMGKHQGRVASDVILGKPARLRPEGNGDGSPRVIFTDPQVAAVGLTLEAAREAGLNVRAVDVGTQANAGGAFYGKDARGTSRIVVDEDRRVVVGATFTGPDVQDSLHAATIAVVAQVPLDDLWHAVPSFPTRSEWWLHLFEAYGL
jgi:dihydrolipoamide dehydrogenase